MGTFRPALRLLQYVVTRAHELGRFFERLDPATPFELYAISSVTYGFIANWTVIDEPEINIDAYCSSFTRLNAATFTQN